MADTDRLNVKVKIRITRAEDGSLFAHGKHTTVGMTKVDLVKFQVMLAQGGIMMATDSITTPVVVPPLPPKPGKPPGT